MRDLNRWPAAARPGQRPVAPPCLIIEGTALTLVAAAVQCQLPSPAGAFQEAPGPRRQSGG